jgi:hypothetical protein
MGEEFFLITPTEIRGLRITLPLAFIGCGVFWLSGKLPLHSSLGGLSFIAFAAAVVGIIVSLVFGFLALFEEKDIARYSNIKKIIVSGQGVALYRRDDSVDLLLSWQQIKAVQVRGLKHMFLGVVETGQEPVAIVFDLVDGSSFTIPMHLILKESDRTRMVSVVSRFLPFRHFRPSTSSGPKVTRAPSQAQEDLYRTLLAKTRYDKGLADRLIDCERARIPRASFDDLCRSAISRWERDNR